MAIATKKFEAIKMTQFSFLSIIASLYVAVGISCLCYISTRTIGRRAWRLPILRLRWDRHGFNDICIGLTYAGADQLIRIGLLTH
ncbi:MAG: hypothetical protein QOJ84_746 [Bradyrhizobium sp.]|jgi:hypothetical protein|nr:hypothetical protein [Bradyrhizobium sp.]